MSRIAIAPVKNDSFSLTPAEDGDQLVVTFSGNGDMDATAVLYDFLRVLHAEACRVGVREVVFDLNDLAFMNSSCFRCFVTWVGMVSKLEDGARYEITFLSNPRLQWQRRSLEALQRFAPGVVHTHAAAG